MSSWECPICFLDDGIPVACEPCEHIFCAPCYFKLRNTLRSRQFPCPLCRHVVTGYEVNTYALAVLRLDHSLNKSLHRIRSEFRTRWEAYIGDLCAEVTMEQILETCRDSKLWKEKVMDSDGYAVYTFPLQREQIHAYAGRNKLEYLLWREYSIELIDNGSEIFLRSSGPGAFLQLTHPYLAMDMRKAAKDAAWDMSSGIPMCNIGFNIPEHIRYALNSHFISKYGIKCIWHETSYSTGLVFMSYDSVVEFLRHNIPEYPR